MTSDTTHTPSNGPDPSYSSRDSSTPAEPGTGTQVLGPLRGSLDRLPRVLGRIAKYILENPEKVVHQSVMDLGSFSRAGQASVVRLCRELGFTGFREFKLALAADLARRPSKTTPDAEGDNAAIDRIRTVMTRSVEDICDGLNTDVLDEIAQRFLASRRVDVFGAGGSGIVGEYLAYRLLRRGLTAQAFRDATMAHEVAHGLDSKSVAVGISRTGITPETVQFLQNAKATGAFTVAVTDRLRSPLAGHADQVLLTSTVEPTVDGDGLTLTPRMFAIEVLAIFVTGRQG